MHKEINYINGFKGFCAIGVTILHYFIAYGDFGYFGWQSGVEESQKVAHYWEYFPFSLITNGNFILYAFFTLIAFIPALRFFSDQDQIWLKKQIYIRYFRFLPYAVLLTFLSYFLYINNAYFNNDLGDLLNIPWNKAMFAGEISLWTALSSAFVKMFVVGDGAFVSPFWCMNIIFLGSYLTYALLLFFGNLPYRLHFYALSLALSFFAPFYSAFVFGVIAADICTRTMGKEFPRLSLCIFALGLIAANFGELLVHNVNLKLFVQNFGVFLLILAMHFSKSIQRIFEHPIFLWCGRRSFELILVHCPIMFSISTWMFLELHTHIGYILALCITFLLAIPINALAMEILAKVTAPLSKALSNFVYAFVTK